MKFIRRLHLYLSVFFAPLLIFFVATGWYQTVSTQRNKLLGEQDTFATRLTSIHVDQIYPSETAGLRSTRTQTSRGFSKATGWKSIFRSRNW